MPHWPFVVAAYAIAIAGTAAVAAWSWWTMRSGERRAAALREGKGE